jgi:hypothetical protein
MQPEYLCLLTGVVCIFVEDILGYAVVDSAYDVVMTPEQGGVVLTVSAL